MVYKVCVRCFTYNQSKFITETMDGFVIQKTDFPFVCCIVDDASSDGEQEVISKYLEDHFVLNEDIAYEKETDYAWVHFARHKENKNCYFAVLFLKENHRRLRKPKYKYLLEWQKDTPYLAICEGDDYWISSDKLQKQASFLDIHPDYCLTYCDANIVGINSEPIQRRKPKRYSGDCRKSLIKESNYLVTAGVCFRSEFVEEWRAVRRQIPVPIKPMVVYRLQPESASHSLILQDMIDFYNSDEAVSLYLNKIFNIGVSDRTIHRKTSLCRARFSVIYSRREMIATFKRELTRFPSLAFNIRLQSLFFLRLLGIRR